MRLVKYLLLFIITLFLALFFFMPRENLYYLLEKELQKQNIIISNEKFSATPISINIEHAQIIAQDIPVAKVAQAKLLTLLFYNQANIYDIEFNDLAKNYLQSNIDTITLKQTILKPFIINVAINGEFGKAIGYVDLKKHLLHLNVTLDKNIPTIKRYLQHGDKGWYYEYKF